MPSMPNRSKRLSTLPALVTLMRSGFSNGLTRNRDLGTCARCGGLASAEVIGHFDARPEAPLAEFGAAKLG